MAACAWDSASSWVIPQAAQLSRSGTQAMKQPSSSLQKMSISYLLPCSRTAHPFVRHLRRPFIAGMVHDAELGRITRLGDVCSQACPERREFSDRSRVLGRGPAQAGATARLMFRATLVEGGEYAQLGVAL